MHILNFHCGISRFRVVSHLVFLCVLLTGLTGAQEPDPKNVSSLIDQLRHPNSTNRQLAAYDLGKIGQGAKKAVPPLIEVLSKDSDEIVRENAAWALGRIGGAAPQLIVALKHDSSAIVRAYAAQALGEMAETPKEAVSKLIEALTKDQDERVRSFAARALGVIGKRAREAVPHLSEALKDSEKGVRINVANSLGNIGEGAKDAVPSLIKALEDEDGEVRRAAVSALGRIGVGSKEAVPGLIKALEHEDGEVRRDAVSALGEIGVGSKEVLPHIVQALKDPDISVRSAAARALDQLSTALVRARETESRHQLKIAAETMRKSSDSDLRQYADRVQQASEYLELLWWEQLKQWAITHPVISLAAAVYPVLLMVWFSLLWLRPLCLLRINDALASTTDIKLPGWLLGISVAPRYLILVGFFHYHSRVLDAWIANYIDSARENFSRMPTVAEREIYVPLPVVLGNESEAELSPDKLRRIFSSSIICLQVWGEGGAGKTALTCRIARWAMSSHKSTRLSEEHLMLPVLIEQDLVIQDKQPEHPLFKAIKQQTKVLTNEDEPPQAGLLQQLLKKRRVLVIIDGFSELNEASRTATLAGIRDLPVNAVTITTRTDEQLTGLPKTEIKPLRVRGNRLSTFMEAYLTARKKRDLFEDEEFFESCRRLSVIVGDRDITALLAKLYAEQMISMKEGASGSDAPENIPELMLSYLNDLCRDAGPDDPDIRVVHRAVKSVAWECLKKTLAPTPAQRDDVLLALGGEVPGRPLLEYLEATLRVVQTMGAGRDRIRLALDPLAEYFAGMYLVNENGGDEQAWRSFLDRVDEKEGSDIKGFLLAVRDCLLTKEEGFEGLSIVAEELARRAGVRPEESDRYRIERRVRQLISRLKSAELIDRINAAAELGALRTQAKAAVKDLCRLLGDQVNGVRTTAALALGFIGANEAVPHLIQALRDPDEDVRKNAADALGRIKKGAKKAVPPLIEALRDSDPRVRKSAAGALGEIGQEAKEAVSELSERLRDLDIGVRGYAAISLGQIGDPSKAVVPRLIETLKDSEANVRMCVATALGTIGDGAKESVPYLIDALKDPEALVRSSAAKAIQAIQGTTEHASAIECTEMDFGQ